jgi:hypothetical protein
VNSQNHAHRFAYRWALVSSISPNVANQAIIASTCNGCHTICAGHHRESLPTLTCTVTGWPDAATSPRSHRSARSSEFRLPVSGSWVTQCGSAIVVRHRHQPLAQRIWSLRLSYSR